MSTVPYGESVNMLVRSSWVPHFDIAKYETVAVSSDIEALETLADEMNKARTEQELKDDVEYEIIGTCKLI